MSRIGRLPVKLPPGTEVKIGQGAVSLKGPRGGMSISIPEAVTVEEREGTLVLGRTQESRDARSLHGMTRKLLANGVVGVTTGFTRVLEINGVGYRAELKGKTLHFALGYSHPILFQLPEGVTAKVDRQVVITLEGSDRQVVGETAAQIRELRPPEPYKGKGIKYAEETIRRKSGKAAGAA